MEPNQGQVVAELTRLRKLQQAAVFVALGLLIVSFAAPNPALAVARAAAWATAGVLSLIFTTKAKRAGAPASYMNAVIYLLVAVVPLLRGR